MHLIDGFKFHERLSFIYLIKLKSKCQDIIHQFSEYQFIKIEELQHKDSEKDLKTSESNGV